MGLWGSWRQLDLHQKLTCENSGESPIIKPAVWGWANYPLPQTQPLQRKSATTFWETEWSCTTLTHRIAQICSNRTYRYWLICLASYLIVYSFTWLINCLVFHTIIGNLLRKLPSYRRWSWSAFTPPRPPLHHVHHQSWRIVGKCDNSSGGENTLTCEALCFFGPLDPIGSLLPWLQDSISLQHHQKKEMRIGELLEDEVGKVHWCLDSWLVDSLVHWAIDYLNQWVLESRKQWVNESLIRGFTESMNRQCFINSSIKSVNHSIKRNRRINELLNHCIEETVNQMLQRFK